MRVRFLAVAAFFLAGDLAVCPRVPLVLPKACAQLLEYFLLAPIRVMDTKFLPCNRNWNELRRVLDKTCRAWAEHDSDKWY